MKVLFREDDEVSYLRDLTDEEWGRLIAPAIGRYVNGSTINQDLLYELLKRPEVEGVPDVLIELV